MARGQRRRGWVLAVFCTGVAALGGSCGSGARLANTKIDGYVIMAGPLIGATVRVYGGHLVPESTTPICEVVTDTTGHWDCGGVGQVYGFVQIEVDGTGAHYAEIAGAAEVNTDPGIVLRGALMDLAPDGAATVTISPLTTLAVEVAEARFAADPKLDGGTLEKAHIKAFQLLGAHFGGNAPIDLGAIRPLNPRTTAAPNRSLTAEVRYGLALAGLSSIAKRIADDSSGTEAVANTWRLSEALVADARGGTTSAGRPLLDGLGPANQRIGLGTCPGMDKGDACKISCLLDDQTLRGGDLFAALGAYMQDPSANRTDLTYADVQAHLAKIADAPAGELFPSGGCGAGDTDDPVVTFVTPRTGDVLGREFAIEVTATDPSTTVASLEVRAAGVDISASDDDPAPARFHAKYVASADGELEIEALAKDPAGHVGTATVEPVVDFLDPGTIRGRCIKGPLDDAEVRAFAWTGGKKGALLAADPDGTTADGAFALTLSGFSGPVLIECGGATAVYLEEAFAGAITLGPNDRLRTVIKDYTDGESRDGVLLSGWSSMAVRYLEWLLGPSGAANQAELLGKHFEAYSRISDLLDIGGVDTTQPAPLDGTLTNITNERNRYALENAGFSALAVAFAHKGGVTPGVAVNGANLWQALEADLGDGCFDGRDGAGMPLKIVGQDVGPDTVRVELATAIYNYLSSPFNGTGIKDADDATDLFDHLSEYGPALAHTGPGCAPGEIFPSPGKAFDRTPPLIVFDSPTLPDQQVVRGAVTLKAHAEDGSAPTLTVVNPLGAQALDGDSAAAGVNILWDSAAPGRPDGPLVFELAAVDAVNNAMSAVRTFVVDNTAPKVTIAGITAGASYAAAVSITVSISDAHLATQTVLLDGAPFSSGGTVTTDGVHTLTVNATDVVGNVTNLSVPFTIDTNVPIITWAVGTPAGGTFVTAGFSATATASDPQAIGSFTITQPVGGADTVASVEVIQHPVPVPPGIEDTYTLAVRAQDLLGNVATDARSWKRDSKAPVITFGGPSCGGYFKVAQAPTFSVQDGNPGTVTAKLDGAPFVSGTAVADEGAHTLVVTATDAAGNGAQATCTFTLDYTAPTITFDPGTPVDGAVKNGNFNVQATATDANLAANPDGLYIESAPGVTGLVDGDSGASHLVAAFPTLSLGDGAYTVTLRAKDKAGNVSSAAARTFVVDRTAPVFAINTVPTLGNGGWTNAATLTVSVAVTENNRNQASESVSVSGCAGPSGSSPYVFVCSAEGLKSLSASGQDVAGNPATPVLASYYVDRTAPTTSVEAASPAAGAPVRGTFTVSALVDDNFKGLGAGSLADTSLANATVTGPCAAAASAPQRQRLTSGPDVDKVRVSVVFATSATHDGGCSVTFSASDAAGNVAAPAVRAVTVDNTAPTVALTHAPWGAAAARKVTGVTNEPVASVTVTVDSASASANLVTATSFERSATLSEGEHVVSAVAIDLAGNASAPVTGMIGFDDSKPTLTVTASSTLKDESKTGAAGAGHCIVQFPTVPAGQPPGPPDVNCEQATDTITLDSNPSGSGRPTVYKMSNRLGPAGSGEASENPIVWQIVATDLGPGGVKGSGIDWGASSYRVIGPNGPGPTRKDFIEVPGTVDPNDRAIRVDTSTAGTSALKTVAGPWRVEVTLVDLVGKVREPIATELDWQHEPLGAPVRVSLVGQPVWPYMPANAKLWERSLGDSDLAAALNGLGAGNGLAVVEYLVENGTSEDVNVFLFVAPPQAGSVVASTTYVDRSPVLEYLKGGKVIPNVKCEFFRILSSGFFECSGSGGWTKPSPKDKENSSGWDASAYFIDGVRVFREVTTIDELSPCAGCATTLPGSIQAGREFTIKAGQRYHVMMVAEDLHFLAPPAASGAIFMEALAPTGGTVPITHTLGEVWGQCTSWAFQATALGPPPPPPPPPDDKCVAQTKFQRYQALKSARLEFKYDRLDLKLRTRPAVTAGLVMPEYEKDDQSNTSQTLPDWATCEGVFAGTTCTATAGAFP